MSDAKVEIPQNNSHNGNDKRGGGSFSNRGTPRGGGIMRGNWRGGGRGGGTPGGSRPFDGENNMNNRGRGPNFKDRVIEKLMMIQGPSHELPSLETTAEKRFSGRCRLYVGNLAPEFTEEYLKKLLEPYGELGEVFFNTEKKFAFVRLPTRADSERFKRDFDGKTEFNRQVKIRFAPLLGAIRISNLSPFVSNELLHRAFSIFGEIDRCVVHADERGKSKQTAVVEFERKAAALEAVKRCTEGCFFITSSLRPVVVSLLDDAEEEEGFPEKNVQKRAPGFHMERETGPRFAEPESFEFEYGQKWKALYELKKQKMEAVEREMEIDERKLEAQMEVARYEHETETLRNQLRRREANSDQHKSQWQAKEQEMAVLMKVEQKKRNEDEQRIVSRMQEQDEHLRQRHQENSMFMQQRAVAALSGGGGGGPPPHMGGGPGGFNLRDGGGMGGGPPNFRGGGGGGFRPENRGGPLFGSNRNGPPLIGGDGGDRPGGPPPGANFGLMNPRNFGGGGGNRPPFHNNDFNNMNQGGGNHHSNMKRRKF